jgi:RES domain-containing protein
VLSDHIRPWSGSAYRHIPADSPYHVLDTRFAGRVAENRWNVPGEPTFYLAGDVGVALAEYARHFQERRTPALALVRQRRALYRLELSLDHVLDLREASVRRELDLHGGPRRFLDLNVARATARFIRVTTPAEGLLVPSVAFLDEPNRWNLVLFLEKLPKDLSSVITVHSEGMFEIGS